MTDNDLDGLILLAEAGVLFLREEGPYTLYLDGNEPWMYLWLDKPSFVLNWYRWKLRPGGKDKGYPGLSQKKLRKFAKVLRAVAKDARMHSPLSKSIAAAVERHQRTQMERLYATTKDGSKQDAV
jgi:hypothetical protein